MYSQCPILLQDSSIVLTLLCNSKGHLHNVWSKRCLSLHWKEICRLRQAKSLVLQVKKCKIFISKQKKLKTNDCLLNGGLVIP